MDALAPLWFFSNLLFFHNGRMQCEDLAAISLYTTIHANYTTPYVNIKWAKTLGNLKFGNLGGDGNP